MAESSLERMSPEERVLQLALTRDFWLNEQAPGDPGDGQAALDARLVVERLLNVRAAAYPCYTLSGRMYVGPCLASVSLLTGLADMDGVPRPRGVSQKRWGAGLRAAARAAWLEPAVRGDRDAWLWVVSDRGLADMGIADPFYRDLVARVIERHVLWTHVVNTLGDWKGSGGRLPAMAAPEYACAPGVEDPQAVLDAMNEAVRGVEEDVAIMEAKTEALRTGVLLGREMLEGVLHRQPLRRRNT